MEERKVRKVGAFAFGQIQERGSRIASSALLSFRISNVFDAMCVERMLLVLGG